MRRALHDVVGLAGFVALLVGLYRAWAPATPIVGGLLAIAWAVLCARSNREGEP